MKKLISICFLWAISLALWGQTNGKYDEGFNPANPGNPQEPTVTMKYDFKVTSGNGGYANQYPSGSKFVKGTQIQLNANPYNGYKFKCWMQDGEVISTSSWFYYTMPAKDVEVQAVFAFEPVSPTNPDVIPLTYKVTVEASPSNAGSVYREREKVNVGEYTYVSASSYNGYRFKGWLLDGEVVSTNSYYNFEMPSRNMHFTALYEFDPSAPGNPSNNPSGSMTYLVRYIIDGQVCYTEYLPAGATIAAIANPSKKGHTFSGWMNLPTLMPANNLDISGTFTVNNYHVVYNVEDKVIHEEDVPYGSVLTPPVGEAREGHTLTWKNLPSAMPDSDITVNGYYSVNKYKLTYILDGKVSETTDVTYGTPITPKVVDEREGYTFSGWSEIPATMPAKDVIITGSFSVNSYSLTYKVDGAEYKTATVAYGTKLTALAAPVKEGHTFSGWSEIPGIMPANDVIVEGSFSINSYTLTYTVDGKEYKTDTIVYRTELTAIEAPTKEGHTFSGWSEIPATMPAQDVTIVGSFAVNSYVLTYTVDGKEYKTDSIAYGTPLTALAAPTKEGHTFSGWSEIPATMPAQDVTVTGLFTINTYKLTYTVDGKEYETDSIAYGTALSVIATPVKEGYTFSGWSEIPATMPAQDVAVSGMFTINKYLVVFKIGDDVIVSDSLEYNSVIVAPEAPEKEGHTFNGWGEVAETVPANDVIYEGSYTANTYKVYYYVGEELVHTEEVMYGEAIPEYTYEPEEGYTFLGWIGESYETMPAHDVTYTANIESGIEHMTIGNGQLIIYDLAGRKVTDTQNLKGGIYIINGKKVVVK